MISIDYMFMSDDQGVVKKKGMPTLVAKDRKTNIIRARVIPQKGKHWYGVKITYG